MVAFDWSKSDYDSLCSSLFKLAVPDCVGGRVELDTARHPLTMSGTCRRAGAKRRRDEATVGAKCQAKIHCRYTSAGFLFVALMKHYLFVRGLLPAPFESIEAQLEELGEEASREACADDAKRAKRRSNGALKRFLKQMAQIQEVMDVVQQVQNSSSGPLNLLLLLGPSASRPKEAVELTLPALLDADSEAESPRERGSPDQRTQASHAHSANRKARVKLIRQVLPAVSTLPLPRLSGNVKMFVCVKAHAADMHGDHFDCRPDYHCSLKNCITTVVNVSSGHGCVASSELERTLHAHRSMEGACEPVDLAQDGRTWFLLRDSVKGLRNCDESQG